MQKLIFSTTSALTACALGVLFVASLSAQVSARLTTAIGTVETVRGPLSQGQEVPFDISIWTGADALAIVHVTWPVGNETCVSQYVFGFGKTAEIKRPTGRCEALASVNRNGVSLKTGYADSKGDTLVTGVTPAVAAAYAEFDLLADSLLKGMGPLRDNESRRAPDYRTLRFRSAAACASACANDARCYAMTFIKSNGLCYLKQERGTPTPHPDMISAVRRGTRELPWARVLGCDGSR
jgi:hypothetical protein